VAVFAQFVIIPGADKPFLLPDPVSGATRRCLKPLFKLENLVTDRNSVLMFMLKTEGRGRLQMRINNVLIDVDVPFDSSDSKSWRSFHEILPSDNLQEFDNELCLTISDADATGKVQISDPVMLYHASG
jgi:hypothetical protein